MRVGIGEAGSPGTPLGGQPDAGSRSSQPPAQRNPPPPALSPCSLSSVTRHPVCTRSQRPPAIRSPRDRVSRCRGDHSTWTLWGSPGSRAPPRTRERGSGQTRAARVSPYSQPLAEPHPAGKATLPPAVGRQTRLGEDVPRRREGSGRQPGDPATATQPRTRGRPRPPARPGRDGPGASRPVLAAYHASRTQGEIPPHVNVNCKHLLLKRTPFFKSPQRSGYAGG